MRKSTFGRRPDFSAAPRRTAGKETAAEAPATVPKNFRRDQRLDFMRKIKPRRPGHGKGARLASCADASFLGNFSFGITRTQVNTWLGNGVCRPAWENRLTISVLMTPTNKPTFAGAL
jgi:hypothetical protein